MRGQWINHHGTKGKKGTDRQGLVAVRKTRKDRSEAP